MDLKLAKQYRGKATECRVLAQTVTDKSLRKHLLQIAKAWDKLAREMERRPTVGKGPM